jgi:hypothetical protein
VPSARNTCSKFGKKDKFLRKYPSLRPCCNFCATEAEEETRRCPECNGKQDEASPREAGEGRGGAAKKPGKVTPPKKAEVRSGLTASKVKQKKAGVGSGTSARRTDETSQPETEVIDPLQATVPRLKDALKSAGLVRTGKRAELAQRLIDYRAGKIDPKKIKTKKQKAEKKKHSIEAPDNKAGSIKFKALNLNKKKQKDRQFLSESSEGGQEDSSRSREPGGRKSEESSSRDGSCSREDSRKRERSEQRLGGDRSSSEDDNWRRKRRRLGGGRGRGRLGRSPSGSPGSPSPCSPGEVSRRRRRPSRPQAGRSRLSSERSSSSRSRSFSPVSQLLGRAQSSPPTDAFQALLAKLKRRRIASRRHQETMGPRAGRGREAHSTSRSKSPSPSRKAQQSQSR